MFHFGDLLLPKTAVFYLKPEKQAHGKKSMKPEQYDDFIMCDQIRDPEENNERIVDPLPSDKAMEKSKAHILAHIVFLFDTILQERYVLRNHVKVFNFFFVNLLLDF